MARQCQVVVGWVRSQASPRSQSRPARADLQCWLVLVCRERLALLALLAHSATTRASAQSRLRSPMPISWRCSSTTCTGGSMEGTRVGGVKQSRGPEGQPEMPPYSQPHSAPLPPPAPPRTLHAFLSLGLRQCLHCPHFSRWMRGILECSRACTGRASLSPSSLPLSSPSSSLGGVLARRLRLGPAPLLPLVMGVAAALRWWQQRGSSAGERQSRAQEPALPACRAC